MRPSALHPLETQPAAEVCRNLDFEEASRQLLEEGMSAADFLQGLRKRKHYQDALKLLAHAMPGREAVWWGCRCVRGVLRKNPDPVVTEAVEAAERWVADPSEENRRAAVPIAEAANRSGLGGLTALAVEHSRDPDDPGSLRATALTGAAVYGVLMLTVAAERPRLVQRRYRTLLDQGLEILTRGIRS